MSNDCLLASVIYYFFIKPESGEYFQILCPMLERKIEGFDVHNLPESRNKHVIVLAIIFTLMLNCVVGPSFSFFGIL